MVPYKDGKANHGHSCVKGRFAYGYATHRDRILKPMIRAKVSEPGVKSPGTRPSPMRRPSSSAFRRNTARTRWAPSPPRAAPMRRPTSSKNSFRAGFGNNNVDTCARVCHSPTGYGLGTAFGTSAGTQDFDSVDESDVIMIIGANPTDGHPVFASRMKKDCGRAPSLLFSTRARIDLVRMPHVEADYHLPLQPGTNVAVLTALAHVIVTEGLVNEAFVRERCDPAEFQDWAEFVSEERHSPEAVEKFSGVPADLIRKARASLCHRRQFGDLLRARRHRAQPGFDHGGSRSPISRWRLETLAGMALASILCAARTMCRALATWAPSRMSWRDTGTSPTPMRARSMRNCGRHARQGAGPAHSEHARRRRRGHVQGHLHRRRGHPPIRPPTPTMCQLALPRWNA